MPITSDNDVAYICLPNDACYTLSVFVKGCKGDETQGAKVITRISAVVYSLNKFGFIDIEITAGTKLLEVLYAYRINFIAHRHSLFICPDYAFSSEYNKDSNVSSYSQTYRANTI